MNTLYTVGYQCGITAQELWQAVQTKNMLLVDTRYSPASRFKPEWSRKQLSEVFGKHYLHLPTLGNVNYKNGGDILIAEPETGIPQVVQFLQEREVMLMCACWDAASCHRTVVAQMVRDACGCEVVASTKPQIQAWAIRQSRQMLLL